jgi:ribonuclease P protein component
MKSPAAFDRTYARRKSASDGVLIVYACENGLSHPRLGCSVSRKVGGAVVRNRVKRLFREAFRLEQAALPAGVDLVVIPRPGGLPTLAAVRESLVKLARQAARKLGSGPSPGVGSRESGRKTGEEAPRPGATSSRNPEVRPPNPAPPEGGP